MGDEGSERRRKDWFGSVWVSAAVRRSTVLDPGSFGGGCMVPACACLDTPWKCAPTHLLGHYFVGEKYT